MFSNASGIVIQGGTFVNNSPTFRTSRGTDLLLEWVATGAVHDSDELYDAPKCHPHTRVAVLDDIMQWVGESESGRDEFMMWLFGPAGAGKSAIAKRIAEIAAEKDLLIADFFFSKSSTTRNTKDRLIATLAYQLALSIPDTRSYIEDAIERDPTIFRKNVTTQIDTLLIRPLQSISSIQTTPSKKLIIIDGLDECNDSRAQLAILQAISRSFPQLKFPIIFLVTSRPEPDIVMPFNCNEPLRSIHRRLALDDTYRPDDDIRLFFSDKFKQIRLTHPLKSTIPISWPTQEMLDTLVGKSSGQFIYASTVVKFVESSCHRPSARLNIILGISPPGRTNPFAELDALYSHILESVDDIQITLRVLSLYFMAPELASQLRVFSPISPELLLCLEPGDIQAALINLSSIVAYHESSGVVKSLHASLVDFLSDKHRSTIFYIDRANTCTDFARRILQYVKAPDGIRAGDIRLLCGLSGLAPWILQLQLRSEILNFDFDAFINTSITWKYNGHPHPARGSTIFAFLIWKDFLNDATLEDRDKKEALDQVEKSLESRLQSYQSHWRLKLLVPLAAVIRKVGYCGPRKLSYCRRADILLAMVDRDLHLVDQHALDLRHPETVAAESILSPYIDGDTYASAALHCMRFLSNPPQYFKISECPEMGLIYVEWKDTCAITLGMLCELLQRANTLPELVRFIIDHDIQPTVREDLYSDLVQKVDDHILAFLSQANVCSNQRIISAIQRSLIITHQQSSIFDEDNASSDDKNENDLIGQRIAQCCSKEHFHYI